MYMLFFLLVIMMSLFVSLVNNIFFWWSVFLIMTVLIIFMNKKFLSYSSIFNYFVLQESLGLIFLLCFSGFLPLLIMMIKIGVAPFHFWLFKVIDGMFGFNLVWFLTIHKLPFLLVFLQLFYLDMIYFLLMGMVLCLFQLFMMKSFKKLLLISTVESFSWIVLGLVMSFFNVLYLFFYYLILMVFLIYKFNKNVDLVSGLSWELVLVFMNMPFSVGFFVKIILLMEFLKGFSMYMILIMFLMFLSILSLSFWLVILSVKKLLFSKYNFVGMIYSFPLMVMVLL
uniref:NADH dehydrogenase subunit 2 n=2 Tax=Angiostrongylus TaxID=6312 RepID=A0A0M3SH00_ANGCA|nr:NADH dehydrogenase subunit 2 [Angiostrongylus malaysiensis]ALD62330.1 NADH dehydrogenase subunit 2 [Angiostrongylus cantonensis]ANG44580.1 NADH dehydrogenase subunit 2 [Angiostrongylus malaysiensis]